MGAEFERDYGEERRVTLGRVRESVIHFFAWLTIRLAAIFYGQRL